MILTVSLIETTDSRYPVGFCKMRRNLASRTGIEPVLPRQFHGFADLDAVFVLELI
jgi:hypothetical protein